MNAPLVEYHVVTLSSALKEVVAASTNPTQIGFLVPYVSYMAPEILQAVFNTFTSYGISASRLDAPPRIHFVLPGCIADHAAAVTFVNALPEQYTQQPSSTQSPLDAWLDVSEFVVEFFGVGRKFRSELIVTTAIANVSELTTERDAAHLAYKAAKCALDTAITNQVGVKEAAEKLTDAFRAHRLARLRRSLADLYQQLVTMLERKSPTRFVLLKMQDVGITEKGLNLIFSRLSALGHTIAREPEERRNTTDRVLNLIVENPKEQILYVISRRAQRLDC